MSTQKYDWCACGYRKLRVNIENGKVQWEGLWVDPGTAISGMPKSDARKLRKFLFRHGLTKPAAARRV